MDTLRLPHAHGGSPQYPGVAPKFAVSLAAALAVVAGGMVLAGWALDITALKSILPGWVSVKPNTALAFILTGIALPFSSRSRLARLCGLLAGLLGLLTLGEYAFDWNPGFDQWLFPEPAGTVGTSNPGRMAPETALCFVLLAAGLEIARSPRKTARMLIASVILGSVVTTLALAAVLTYFTPALGAYGWWGKTMMAVPTATLFSLLGGAMVLAAWRENASIWSLGGRITAAFACGFLLLVVIGLTTARSQVRLHDTNDRIARSEELLRGITSILAEVSAAQIHVRGFIITGEEQYLNSYLAAQTRGHAALDAIRRIVAGRPPLQPRFSRLKAQAAEALRWFRLVTDTRRTGPGAVHFDQIRHGEDLMDALRVSFEQLENEERQLLRQTTQELDYVNRFTDAVIVAGTVLSLIAFLSALLALNDSAAERIRAEGTLRGEEERFRLVVGSASDVIYEWDIGTRVQWFGRIDELMGYAPGVFPRTLEGWAGLLHPDDRGRVMAAVERTLGGEAAYDIEYRVRKRDGAYCSWWARGTVLRDADGKPYRWVGSITDITKRKQEALRIAALLELSTSANTSDDRTLMQHGLDTLQRLTDSRIGFLHFVNADQNEIELVTWSTDTLAHYCKAAFDSHYPVSAAGIWADCIRRKQPVVVNDYAAAPGKRGLPKGHSDLRRFISVPIFESGLVRMIIGVGNAERDYEVHDVETGALVGNDLYRILQRRRAEQEVHRLNRNLEKRIRERTAQLEAANKELEAFSYSASHDLRAPLQTIDGFSRALEEDYGGKLDGEARDYLRRLRGASQRMALLIDDLLNLSRVSRAELAHEVVDLSAQVREIGEDLRSREPRRDVTLEVAPQITAVGDRRLLRVMLENLLGNAWKFTSVRPHARIEFGAVERDGERVFFIRDDGAGFDPALSAKLFVPFQRLHSTSAFPGTGIGLATVRRIVQRHGGRAWAEGAVDRGATFHFTISGEPALTSAGDASAA